jgi:SAM-dependent methyltransferase
MPDDLPEYAKTQLAFHRAFGRDLMRGVRSAAIPRRGTVLDVPAGDGFYSLLLARRMYPHGRVVAADISTAYLDRARERIAKHDRLAPVEFRQSDAYALPFDDASFDAVWCAESLISLTDPVKALREMRRVVKPGGAVLVLEADEFHHVILNWPVALELDVSRAIAAATRSEYGTPAALSPARKVRGWLAEAGLVTGPKRTIAADRVAPFGPAVRRFLRYRFAETRALIAPHLSAESLAAYDAATHPRHPGAFLQKPDAELTCLISLFLARRPVQA